MSQVLAVIGVIGGFLCACSDCFLDVKGADNQKLGKMEIMDSKWETMAHWRFVLSDILAMFAVPMYTCGFVALMMKLLKTYETLAIVMTIIFLCGAMGGFMIHTFLCIVPTIYQNIIKKDDGELAETVINAIFRQIYVPFLTLYSMLVIIPSLVIMFCIITGILTLPLWCIILNPLVFQIIGILLRTTKCKLFIDVPSICAASLGLAMYGVLALMLL